jgi:hypothetical protein
MTELIATIGPPPERYADRVVAEMMRELARKHATLWDTIEAVLRATRGGAGSPRAQRRLAERIERAGAYHTQLDPGKRGRFTILIQDFVGHDPSRDHEIRLGDPIPEKPWIACNQSIVESRGGGRDMVEARSLPILFITCHSMSRVAQRFGARTPEHLMRATEVIWGECVHLINTTGTENEGALDWYHKCPPDGWRVPLEKSGDIAIAVLKRHYKRKALICATVLRNKELP